MKRRDFLQFGAMASVYPITASAARLSLADRVVETEPQPITLNANRVIGPLPHVWEEGIGSDRAVEGLRSQWQSDLRLVHAETGIKAVRFHGVFNDEMGVCPGPTDRTNFLYIDMVYDSILALGMKPFVELSFMPGCLASGKTTVLWYKANTSPPTDFASWGKLVQIFAQHLIERYGIDEVRQWNFEVWNEPNIIFWSGTKEQYFELYRTSSLALKSVSSELKVGGPSTAEASWVPEFLEFCSANNLPIDFVSTHVYPDDPQRILFGENNKYPYEEVIPRSLTKVQDQIKASKIPALPLLLTEWSSQNPAFIAHTIKSCIGLTSMMSYWCFDSVYEELGIQRNFSSGTYGLLGVRGVPRPSFNTFKLLHRLGDVRLDCTEGPVLATRRKDGSLAVLAWNLIPVPKGKHGSMGDPLLQTEDVFTSLGPPLKMRIAITPGRKKSIVALTRVDSTHGSAAGAYKKMGNPAYPSASQIDDLIKAAQLRPAENLLVDAQHCVPFSMEANSVVLLEIARP